MRALRKDQTLACFLSGRLLSIPGVEHLIFSGGFICTDTLRAPLVGLVVSFDGRGNEKRFLPFARCLRMEIRFWKNSVSAERLSTGFPTRRELKTL